jgi:hypothetical protein
MHVLRLAVHVVRVPGGLDGPTSLSPLATSVGACRVRTRPLTHSLGGRFTPLNDYRGERVLARIWHKPDAALSAWENRTATVGVAVSTRPQQLLPWPPKYFLSCWCISISRGLIDPHQPMP